jgi:fibronectin-binding autotransporter adhesin
MKPNSNAFLRASRLALLTISLSTSVHAGTTWDGGGAANTNIDLADNWDGTAPGVVNALNGTTAASFATGGNAAAMNVPARFTTITFNRNNAGGFAISGASTLSVNQSTAGGTINLGVSDTAGNGVSSISSAFQVNTDAGGGNRFLNIKNDEKDVAAGSLLVSGGISASTPANTYQIRAGGTGVTVLSGTLSHVSGIQQVNSGTSSGKVIVNGSQNLGSASVNIPSSTSGTVSSAYTIQMGSSTADIQSWGSTTINQNATVSVKSTATLSGAVSVGANGANLVVDGALSATALSLGGATAACNLKIGGSASFSGNIAIGAAAGNLIVGNATTNGTLSLSSGTISNNVTIGGANPNENNLKLTKISSGILNLNGTHTYTGDTNVNVGTLNLGGSLASPIIVNAGATLTGEGSTSSSLTFATGSSALSFDPGTQTAALTADTVDVSAAGIVLVSPSAATTPASTYTVLKCVTGSFAPADLAKFALATRGGSLSITGAGKEITLTAAAPTPVALVWKGNDATNPTFWDVANTQNWDNSGTDRFYTGDAVTFNDSASTFAVVVQGTTVSPGNILFDNTTANAYTVSGGSIGGAGSLTKDNTGTVTLANSLAHTNGITINAGILDLGTANNTFTGGINIAGGELKFGGAALPSTGSLNSQAVTLNGGKITRTANTTITNESQIFTINTNASEISVDTNATTTWRIGGKISGAGNWTKSGAGVLALGNNSNVGPANDFSGTVTVTEGTLDVRHSNSLGSTAAGTSIQGAALIMQNFGQTTGSIITVDEPLDFSGTSFLTGYCQETKTFTQQFNGTINVAAAATLGIATARAGATTAPLLELNGASITTGAGSTLSLGGRAANYPGAFTVAAQTINIGAPITGPAAVTVQGDTGFTSVYTLSAPGYSGNTTVNSGTLKLGAVNVNNDASTITVESGAKIDIAFSGNDTVGTLILGGTNVGPGTYNASHPTYGSYFTATDSGSIVVPAPVGGYSAWQNANGAGVQTVDQDHDNDGVDNGVEYFMGGNTNTTGFTATPALNSSNNITWTMGDTYSGTYGTDYVVQTSSNLTAWSPVAIGDVVIDNTIPNKSVSYTLTGVGKRFVRLLVNPN